MLKEFKTFDDFIERVCPFASALPTKPPITAFPPLPEPLAIKFGAVALEFVNDDFPSSLPAIAPIYNSPLEVKSKFALTTEMLSNSVVFATATNPPTFCALIFCAAV